MNEMLANQYFISGRYQEASYQYDEVLKIHPENYLVKKKLVLCYIKTCEIDNALTLFTELIKSNNNIIFKNEISIYPQICKDIIYDIENFNSNFTPKEKYLILGILYMYCDFKIAKGYFQKLKNLLPNDDNLLTTIKTINHFITKKKELEDGKETLFT